jgi:hypothetical protein|uniref:PolyVal Metallopeptidase superfamily domain n=1 Tax=Siphoviridae sp. ctNLX12 TaxID=2825469 RepID=A0A8S5UDQ6_9CAUD|nr:MAG TPA: PolyVal Metallopeptidase superfamily domain [Siphoviridae sp. ctNLX12]
MFKINNKTWEIVKISRQNPMLMRSDGSRTVGMTDRDTKRIYLADDLRGKFLDRVLCHELCHAFCLSYNVYMDIDTEEIVADFLATYGREVFEIADRLLIELMEVA